MASAQGASLSPAFLPGRYGFWLVSLVPASLVALLFAVLYLVPALRFTRHGLPAIARVIGTPCADGHSASYVFQVGGREIRSSTQARYLDLPCSALAVGDAVAVVYLPSSPAVTSGAAGLPGRLQRAILATVVGFLVTLVGILAVVTSYARDGVHLAKRVGA